MRKPLVVANWKMNKSSWEAAQFFSAFFEQLEKSDSDFWFAPSFTLLSECVHTCAPFRVKVGAQNLSQFKEGALTGEISAKMVKDAGATFSIIGHSERRHHFLESNAQIKEKILRCKENKLISILCVGETLAQREQDEQEKVVATQILEACNTLDDPNDLIIAYEPVWAIGTGKSATAEQAQQMHAFIRSTCAQKFGVQKAASLRLLYGGSVTAANSAALFAQPDIDGALVGGASLDPIAFAQIVKLNRYKS